MGTCILLPRIFMRTGYLKFKLVENMIAKSYWAHTKGMALSTLSHLILTTLWNGDYYYLYFADKETET